MCPKVPERPERGIVELCQRSGVFPYKLTVTASSLYVIWAYERLRGNSVLESWGVTCLSLRFPLVINSTALVELGGRKNFHTCLIKKAKAIMKTTVPLAVRDWLSPGCSE